MGDTGKKQVPLRLSAKLYDAIASWAEDDFRSVKRWHHIVLQII